jgi:hypothetical protein
MKKRILSVLLAVMLVTGAALASGPSSIVIQSTEQSADATVYTGGGWFYGIILTTDGTNSVTVDIYDNTAASGTKLIPTTVIPSSAAERSASIGFGSPVNFSNGIYVDITTSGTAGYMVYYYTKP